MTTPAEAPAPSAAPHLVPLAGRWALWRSAGLRSAGMPFEWLERFAADALEDSGDGADDAAARARSALAVRSVVAEARFLEAVTWQNPALVANWLGEFAKRLSSGDHALKRRDQREAVVEFLAQRYCAKNETIGFFGPVSWAQLGGAGGLVLTGTGALTQRTLHAERWAVAAVADALVAPVEMAEHRLVRRNPVCAVHADVAHVPRRDALVLDAVGRDVMSALSAPSPLGVVLDHCVAGGHDRDAALAAVDRLERAGVVLVGWPVAVDDRPELQLASLVTGVRDDAVRDRLARQLRPLLVAFARVRRCVDAPQELAGALTDLEHAFSDITERSAHQAKPTHRYSRTVVYPEAVRDFRARVGDDLLDALREPLALVLDTSRWLVAEIASEVRRDLVHRHRELASRRPSGVRLADLVTASGDILGGVAGSAVDRVAADFDARWSELRAFADPGGRLRTSAVRALADALFPALRAPWPAARQHSPDLMLAVEPGTKPFWVLGELHLALNTLENRPFVIHADDRTALEGATASDFADGRIVPVYPAESPEVTSRTFPPLAMHVPGLYRYWSYTGDQGRPGADDVLPGAGLLVRESEGNLVVETPDGIVQGDVLTFFGEFLTGLAVDRFRVRTPARHQPRLLLDDLVIARETWRVPVAEVPVPTGTDDYTHRELATWLAALGTPRWVFAKTPGEPKPWLVDRTSPLSLRNLARRVRVLAENDASGVLTLTEMLPGPGQLWLRDADGHYTAELRVVALDLNGTSAAGSAR